MIKTTSVPQMYADLICHLERSEGSMQFADGVGAAGRMHRSFVAKIAAHDDKHRGAAE